MISTREFLELVLPPLEPGECYATFGIGSGENAGTKKISFPTSMDDLLEEAGKLNAGDFNAFFGLASYDSSAKSRKADHVRRLKSFFIDVDFGERKPYKTREEAVTAVKDFCSESGLPRPAVVNSGSGLHLYWVLADVVERDIWKPLASKLKTLTNQLGFHADPQVTADCARVLRIPGSRHLKNPDNPIDVEVGKCPAPIANEVIYAILEVVVEEPTHSKTPSENPEKQHCVHYFKDLTNEKSPGGYCKQMQYAANNASTLSEPFWRSALGIAKFCADAEEAILSISETHPGYSAKATAEKIRNIPRPLSCSAISSANPGGCDGCPHKIVNPLFLSLHPQPNVVFDALPDEGPGATFEKKEVKFIPDKEDHIHVPMPEGFGYTPGVGMWKVNFTLKKEDDDKVKDKKPIEFTHFYRHRLYIKKRMYERGKGELLLFGLDLPQDQHRSFVIPLSEIVSKDKIIPFLAGHGVNLLGKNQDLMIELISGWVTEIQKQQRADIAYLQYGWTEDESAIIIGETEIRADTTLYCPPSGPTLPLTAFFGKKGSFEAWKDTINYYGTPGMEQRAFGFFMGFGALLMRLTVLDGCVVNLYSKESGSGKTTVLQAINSIFGHPKELIISPKDTYNARIQRVGTMKNLPVTMDEITNTPGNTMSAQIYDITSGKGKNRLQQHSNRERYNDTKWQTALITSSNRSLADMLLSHKASPDAELKRVFEINVLPDEHDDPTWAREHFGRLLENYGHAAEPFCQYLVGHMPEIKEKLLSLQAQVEQDASITNTERYWALMISVAILGGQIAKKLGLHDINVQPVYNFALELIRETRKKHAAYIIDAENFLGTFLQKRFSEILVIKNEGNSIPIRIPHGPLSMRYEPDTKLLYVSAATYREEAVKQVLNESETLKPYVLCGACSGQPTEKLMTEGTPAEMGVVSRVYCFDTTKLDLFDDTALLRKSESNGDPSTDPVE